MKLENKLNKNIQNTKLSFFLSIIFLFAISTVSISFADIYISEVLYDPFVSESGGEAVELYNSGDVAINISGFTIKTESSDTDATLPSNAIIYAKGYYLITDNGWDENKDSVLFPTADYSEPITMKNSDSGIILKDIDGNILDIVGWGNPSQEYYNIEPAEMVNQTHSLKRIDYTENNKVDFISSVPDFKNSQENSQDWTGNIFTLKVQIPSSNDYILNFTIETENGNEIYLMPGSTKEIPVLFEVNNKFTKNNISLKFNNQSLEFIENLSKDDSVIYSSVLSLDYYLLKNNYSLNLELTDDINTYGSNINFSIMPVMAFEIDSLYFECNFINLERCEILGDKDIATDKKPTIKNIGNVPLDFKIFSDISLETNLTENYIPDNIIEYSLDNRNYYNLSQDRILLEANLEPGVDASIPFSLILSDMSNFNSGEYKKQFVIMGVEHE